jgi:chromosome segregation ATPase
MTTLDVAFTPERFELVGATSGTVLLRVAGLWEAASEIELGPITLVVDGGSGPTTLHPLPDPSGTSPVAAPEGRPWRGAFPVARSLAEGSRYELHTADGVIAELDAPEPVAAPPAGPPASRGPSEQERLAARIEALTAERDELAAERDALALERARMAERLDELEGRVRERGHSTAPVKRELAAAKHTIRELKAALASAEAGDATEAVRRADELDTRVEALSAEREATRRRLAEQETDLRDRTTQLGSLKREKSAAQHALRDAQRRLDEAEDARARAAAERDELRTMLATVTSDAGLDPDSDSARDLRAALLAAQQELARERSRTEAAEHRADSGVHRTEGEARVAAAAVDEDVSLLHEEIVRLRGEAETAQARVAALSDELLRARDAADDAAARYRQEAEARQLAEARAAGTAPAAPDPQPQDRAEAEADAEPLRNEAARLRAQLEALEHETADARKRLESLSTELLSARRDGQEAVERFRDEAEARERAEARAASLAAELDRLTAAGD